MAMPADTVRMWSVDQVFNRKRQAWPQTCVMFTC